MVNSFASSKSSFSPITLEHRSNDNQNMKIDSEEFVSIPISTLHNILSQPGASQSFNEMDSGTIGNVPNTINTGQRKRRQEQMTKISPMMQIFPDSRLQSVPVFTVPSPVAISPVYVDQKLVPMNTSETPIKQEGDRKRKLSEAPSEPVTPAVEETDEEKAKRKAEKKAKKKAKREAEEAAAAANTTLNTTAEVSV